MSAIDKADTTESDCDNEEKTEDGLKTRFQSALLSHNSACVSLGDSVRELAAAGIERDQAIEWGIETGLSESYVRATVSRFYKELDGGIRKSGAGRKRAKGAMKYAVMALRDSKGDYAKAMSLLLAARRILENRVKAKAAKGTK